MSNLNIKKLILTDYRCFESIEIDFHEQLTVLVASNGAGKTSILDAIAVAFGPYIGAFDEGVGKHFQSTDIRQSRVRETRTNDMEYPVNGVHLEATGCISGSKLDALGELSHWKRHLSSPTKTKTTIKHAKALIDYGKRQQEAVRTKGTDVVLSLLAYYGTNRLWQQKKLRDEEQKGTSRTIGYKDCLDPASSYKLLVKWFRYWSIGMLSERLAADKVGKTYESTEFDHFIESVSGAVNTCLAPTGWKDIHYSLPREKLVVHHDEHGVLPVALLSDGIRNMIGMIADIAFRATKLNPQFGSDAAKKTPGVVLIDEVDMHLHPEWQQVVLGSLTEAFPKLQFIVTTHSPQVLTTVSRENIRILERDDSGYKARIPDFSPLAHESGDALTRVMGTHREPPLPLQDSIHQFEQLVRAGQEQSPEAKQLRAELDKAGYQIHDSDLVTWRFLAARKVGQGN